MVMNFNLQENNLRRDSLNFPMKDRLIKINRVSKVTKGGRILKFQAIVVVGDNHGTVGFGIGKSKEIPIAIEKAKRKGERNAISVPVTKSFSIPHRLDSYFKASKIIIKPSIKGSGVIAGGSIRAILEIVGIQNVIAKQLGSNNLINNAYATIHALKNLKIKRKQRKIKTHKI
uniref:Small ribosomal subunit protein uS5c n=1 Tax=Astrosyne radiata TaxID=1158023 RepID=A0A2U9NTK8_9STRA|nr:ribosomal protein S5 [Astrosyne radiata]AWT40365.1 ribosomal protein S5 [Astrosyne radiata]